jgi:hypothetical protein
MDQATLALAQLRTAVTIDRLILSHTTSRYTNWDANLSARNARSEFPGALLPSLGGLNDTCAFESQVTSEGDNRLHGESLL